MHALLSLVLVVAACAAVCRAQGSGCGQQVEPYAPRFHPLVVEDKMMSLTPFFSPEYDTQIMVNMADAAQHTIDIGNPDFKSWISCGNSYNGGCTPTQLRDESEDPFWVALLNAIHRGVTVRVIYADCDISPVPKGLIVPLPFLQLNGAEVKYYRTTSYYHLKYMSVDNTTAFVASINLSHDSMVDDREAGFLFTSETGQEFINYWSQVFEYDLEKGAVPPINNTYTTADMEIITDKSYIVPPAMPKINDSCAYVPPDPQVITGYMDVTTYTMPDYAWNTLFTAINATQTSLTVYIYVINSWDECNALIRLHKAGIKVDVMVSTELVGSFPIASECYHQLYLADVPLRMSGDCYAFYHQKYWIIDGDTVHMSSGNWDDYDYPPAPHTASGEVHASDSSTSSSYPVNGVNAYRGHTVVVKNSDVAAIFQAVYEGDYAHGHDYYPSYPLKFHERRPIGSPRK